MASSALLAMAAFCQTPGCTFLFGHENACSNAMNLGKRARKSAATTLTATKPAATAATASASRTSAAAAAASAASASNAAGKEDYVPTRKRKQGFWPWEVNVTDPKDPKRKLTNKVVVPAGVNLPANTNWGSAEAKIMNLTCSHPNGLYMHVDDAPEKDGDESESRPRWGGTCSVPKGELDGINHNRPSDNTDMIIISCRDQLTGDVYVFKHVINRNHEYYFNGGTFRTLNPRPRVAHGDFFLPRHRPIDAWDEWIKLLTEWTGGPPILIMHFHPASEDPTWDAERSVGPEGVPIIRGVGCGIRAPTGAEQTHAFLRNRLAKYALPKVDENPLAVFDGTTIKDRTMSSRMNARVQAFDSIFAGGDNTAFGELGCVIAQDALIADGAVATVRHPNSHWHYDLLTAYRRT
jgi:hypothetical protein